ncbi:MAG: alpha/beta hydrolase [Lachnospiraceae bacterium]|jgi:hypothetical protein
MAEKLAVFIPGIGYNTDRPLLYYSRKLTGQLGYTPVCIKYHDMPKKVRGDAGMLEKALKIGLKQAKEQLSDIDFSEYEDVLFVGKSIGTVIAALLAEKVSAPSRLILYTPVEATFEPRLGDAIAFIGEADPWSDLNKVKTLAGEQHVPLYTYPGCNHSLECGDVIKDVDTLRAVMKLTEKFIS